MSLARRAARAALAASFISGGLDQLRDPQPKASPAAPVAKPLADRIPQLPSDPESLVKLDGAIKVAGGLGLVFGPFARPAALLLAGSLVPTTLAGHRFWETTDPDQKASDRVEFFKNVSLFGGLLIAALDTGGRPSIPWVAGRAVHDAAGSVSEAADSVGDAVQGAVGAVAGAAGAVGGAVAHGTGSARSRAGQRAAAGPARGRAGRRAAKAAKVSEAVTAAAAATAAKAAKKAEKAARSGKGAATEVAVAAKEKAGAAREAAVAAKEKAGAAVSR